MLLVYSARHPRARGEGGINRNIPTRHVIIANYDVKFPVTVVTVTSPLDI